MVLVMVGRRGWVGWFMSKTWGFLRLSRCAFPTLPCLYVLVMGGGGLLGAACEVGVGMWGE